MAGVAEKSLSLCLGNKIMSPNECLHLHYKHNYITEIAPSVTRAHTGCVPMSAHVRSAMPQTRLLICSVAISSDTGRFPLTPVSKKKKCTKGKKKKWCDARSCSVRCLKLEPGQPWPCSGCWPDLACLDR